MKGYTKSQRKTLNRIKHGSILNTKVVNNANKK